MNLTAKYNLKEWGKVIVSFSIFFLFIPSLCAQRELYKADSIIHKLFDNQSTYKKLIQSYDANIYVKGNSSIRKKNFLFRYIPEILHYNKKEDGNFMEAFISTHYDSPNLYSQRISALNGTQVNANDLQKRVIPFININVYNSTLFDDHAVIPGKKTIHKYYNFKYIAEIDTLNHKIHRIEIIPRIKSQRLIAGYIDVVEDLWIIFRFDISGNATVYDYRIEAELNISGEDFLLPKKAHVSFHVKLLGNEVINHYYSYYDYLSVTKGEKQKKKEATKYDLSEYFTILNDSIPIIRDSVYWNEKRPIPLDHHEQELFNIVLQNQAKTDTIVRSRIWELSQDLISQHKFVVDDDLQFTYSGLLNPLKLSYSHFDGLKYWQQLKFQKRFSNSQELQFSPSIGYLFKRKEVYFNIPIKWIFKPQRFGELWVDFGNKNKTYPGWVIDQVEEEMPDDINFDDLNLDYYRHYNLNLMSGYEICNGLIITGGIDYDWYNPVKKDKSDDELIDSFSTNSNSDIINLLIDDYRSFAPTIELRYTPQQYYRFRGKKKVYLTSRWPTISLSYGRGISGIFRSNSNYERFEIDIQQKIPIGILNSVQYYIGAGKFPNHRSTYFATFKNFEQKNFPVSWQDPIGGVFHLLDSHWYSISKSYAQAHFMYESPFVLLWLFRNASKDILQERIYYSQLYIPARPCYTEIGYGFGNRIGNIGFFASFNHWEYKSFGVKASFELGK